MNHYILLQYSEWVPGKPSKRPHVLQSKALQFAKSNAIKLASGWHPLRIPFWLPSSAPLLPSTAPRPGQGSGGRTLRGPRRGLGPQEMPPQTSGEMLTPAHQGCPGRDASLQWDPLSNWSKAGDPESITPPSLHFSQHTKLLRVFQ